MPIVLMLTSVSLLILEVVLLARVLIDSFTVPEANRSIGIGKARAGMYRMTEPVIAPVCRRFCPVQIGSVSIDLTMPAPLVTVLLLRSLLPR